MFLSKMKSLKYVNKLEFVILRGLISLVEFVFHLRLLKLPICCMDIYSVVCVLFRERDKFTYF